MAIKLGLLLRQERPSTIHIQHRCIRERHKLPLRLVPEPKEYLGLLHITYHMGRAPKVQRAALE
jgi:hypothetical protein